MNKQKVLT